MMLEWALSVFRRRTNANRTFSQSSLHVHGLNHFICNLYRIFPLISAQSVSLSNNYWKMSTYGKWNNFWKTHKIESVCIDNRVCHARIWRFSLNDDLFMLIWLAPFIQCHSILTPTKAVRSFCALSCETTCMRLFICLSSSCAQTVSARDRSEI